MAKPLKISLDDLPFDGAGENGVLTVCVAVSGGRDSVALLHCLKRLEAESLRLRIIAANVEHGIRGEASKSDSKFVESLCKNLGVPLYSFCVNAPEFAKSNGYTMEQSARILRYEIFDKLLNDGVCDYIALAHHLDDQIETVFMRIIRGTGVRGLRAMSKINGRYIRPLLDFERSDIDAYVAEHSLNFVDDETNFDDSYTRNYLRREIAELKNRFPKLGDSVSRLVKNATEEDEFIEAQVPKIEVKDGEAYIKTSDCANRVIAKRLILKAAAAIGVKQDIEDRHFDLALDLLNAKNGKYINLTHGLCVHKDGDRLAFALDDGKNEFFEIQFCEGDFENLGVSVKRVDKSEVKFNCGALYIDADKAPSGAVMRNRKSGDYICKFGGGTKNLGDFLTDKKVPLRMRDRLIVVAVGSRVLAVFGVDISADVKLDENTKTVYKLKNLK